MRETPEVLRSPELTRTLAEWGSWTDEPASMDDARHDIAALALKLAHAQAAIEAVIRISRTEPVVPADVREFGARNRIEKFTEATYGAAHAELRSEIAKAVR